ncbi:hypothetical protein H4R23_001777 [Coemansia sp. Cherry 401B]|nr:hypothetical protein H4R23_001777 [Coemansia sp. Cherry 401B]
MLNLPAPRRPAAALRKQSTGRGGSVRSPAASRRRNSGSSKQSPSASIPSKKLPLLGVQIGKFVQLASASSANAAGAKLQICIRYMQKGLDISGLRDGDEYMKIGYSDIEAIEHKTCDGLAVLRIVPAETIENLFETDVFDPNSSDSGLKDIFLCFRLQTKGDGNILSRLVTVFQEDITVAPLDHSTYRTYAYELTKPPSIDLISSSDEEGRNYAKRQRGAPKNAVSAAASWDATKIATPDTSGYWASINNEPHAVPPAQRSIGTASGELNGSAAYGKRKSQTSLFDSGFETSPRSGSERYKLRKTLVNHPSGLASALAFDDDDDDLVTQCREFRWDDHTLRFEYPRGGPKPISVTGADICRLYKGEFLNDTILEFYVRYIDENLRKSNPALHKQCFFFNTFFFRKLSQRSKATVIDPDSDPMEAVYKHLQKWTASVQLFEKQYIFVPINENTHWYLAIIANPAALLSTAETAALAAKLPELPSKVEAQTVDSDTEMRESADGRLVTGNISDDADLAENLGSIGGNSQGAAAAPERQSSPTIDLLSSTEGASTSPTKAAGTRAKAAVISIEFMDKTVEVPEAKYLDPVETPSIIIFDSLGNRHQPTFGLLRGYMRAEAMSRHNVDLSEVQQVGKYAKVPLQNNFCDCGVYLLQYIEEFIKDPVAFMALALSGISLRDMFTSVDMEQKRLDILGLATSLAEEHKRLCAEQPIADAGETTETQPSDSSPQRADIMADDTSEHSDTSKIAQLLSEITSDPADSPSVDIVLAPPDE